MKHTKTPWHVDGPRIYTESKTLIATIAHFRDASEEKENADFIVHACNAHDDLVETLKVALTRLGFANKHLDCVDEISLIEAALAKAQS
ncbi:MAG: hypothetical protein NVS3B3_18730 [Aquirhabdus sp.]